MCIIVTFTIASSPTDLCLFTSVGILVQELEAKQARIKALGVQVQQGGVDEMEGLVPSSWPGPTRLDTH